MKLNFTFNKIFIYISLIISGIIFYFVALKAKTVSFTHDESFTYLHYVNMDFLDILSFKNPYTNNHILNSILMKYSEIFFGNSELALRLPNLFALIIYMIYSFKIIKFSSFNLSILFYFILIFNPYLLEFFAIARGYGLSIAFMMMGIYYLIKYLKFNKHKDGIFFNIASLLAILSNFSILNFYLAALLTFNIVKWLVDKTENTTTLNKDNFFKKNRIHLICLAVISLILFEPLRRLSNLPVLDFGGKMGFIEDTIASIINSLFYNKTLPKQLILLIAYVITLICFVILFLIIKKIIKKNTEFIRKNLPLMISNFILLICVFETIAQHYLLHNDYFNGRFALFFYPLFVLNLAFFLEYIYENGHAIISHISVTTVFAVLSVNLFMNYNPNYFYDWYNDIDTRTVMIKLVEAHNLEKEKKEKTTLGIDWLFEPVTNFYRVTWKLTWLTETNRNGISNSNDYYCIFKNDTNSIITLNKKILFESKNNNTLLIKNN